MPSPEGRKFSITSWEGDEEPAPKEKPPAETQSENANPTENIKTNTPLEAPQRKFSITSWEGDQERTQKKAGEIKKPHWLFSWERDEGKIKIGRTLERVRFHGEKSEFKFFTGEPGNPSAATFIKTAGALTGYLLLKGLFTLPITTLNWLIKNIPEKIGKTTINPIDKKAYFEAYTQLSQAFSHKKN